MIDLDDKTLEINGTTLNITDVRLQLVRLAKNEYAVSLTADLRSPKGGLKQKKSQHMTLQAMEIFTGKDAKKKATKLHTKINGWIAKDAARQAVAA